MAYSVQVPLRGSGVGVALLSELCILARNTGYGSVDLIVTTDNVRGRRFYERSGARIFEEVGHVQLDERAINALVEKVQNQAMYPISGSLRR